MEYQDNRHYVTGLDADRLRTVYLIADIIIQGNDRVFIPIKAYTDQHVATTEYIKRSNMDGYGNGLMGCMIYEFEVE